MSPNDHLFVKFSFERNEPIEYFFLENERKISSEIRKSICLSMEESIDKSLKRKEDVRGLKSNEKKRKKTVKRCDQRLSDVKSIPIFTDEFLHLFRKQKSEIRSLKLSYSQLSERLKLKDAEQEQIRLDNQKMRFDIEEISQRNSLLNNQIEQLEKQFEEYFNCNSLSSLRYHSNDQHYQNQMKVIQKNLQL